MDSLFVSEGLAGFLLLACFENTICALFRAGFISSYLKKRAGWPYLLLCIVSSFSVYLLSAHYRLPLFPAVFLELLLYTCAAQVSLKTSLLSSAATSLISFSVYYLSSGILVACNNLFDSFLYSCLDGPIRAWASMASMFLHFPIQVGVIALTFWIILRFFRPAAPLLDRPLLLILSPVFLTFLICCYVFDSVYGDTFIWDSEEGMVFPHVNNLQMLAILLAAYFSLLAVLYACRMLSEQLRLETEKALLEQQAQVQETYLQESELRSAQTRGFRHDIQNHLTVLNGLLKSGHVSEAVSYLNKMEALSDSLSFPCRTGNTALDVLLSSKLAFAQQHGIRVECTVRIPEDGAVEDIDYCVLFSNGVDNAIRACCLLPDSLERCLRITGLQKGSFFLIELENSCPDIVPQQTGIGLSNIRAIAEKYHGTVSAEKRGASFLLSILIINSLQERDI